MIKSRLILAILLGYWLIITSVSAQTLTDQFGQNDNQELRLPSHLTTNLILLDPEYPQATNQRTNPWLLPINLAGSLAVNLLEPTTKLLQKPFNFLDENLLDPLGQINGGNLKKAGDPWIKSLSLNWLEIEAKGGIVSQQRWSVLGGKLRLVIAKDKDVHSDFGRLPILSNDRGVLGAMVWTHDFNLLNPKPKKSRK